MANGKDNKVNRICDDFLSVLNSRIDTNLQNIVTAHVCKSPPDLEAGLQVVGNLRGKYGGGPGVLSMPELIEGKQKRAQNKRRKLSNISAFSRMRIAYLITRWDCMTWS
jgi:hypothetical protein